MDTSARAQESSPPSISTIGEELTITGNVTSKGELHLNGRVLGEVHCVALVLGENAQVEGNAFAEEVIVRGRLIGSVRALRVSLQANSHVEGNLFHKSLSIGRHQSRSVLRHVLNAIGGNDVCIEATRNSDRQGIEDCRKRHR